jgi:hypothetical protein
LGKEGSCSFVGKVKPDGHDQQQRRDADQCNERYPEVEETFEEMFVHVCHFYFNTANLLKNEF